MALNVVSSRPAASRFAIAFCCDANYLPFALCAADRIRALPGTGDIDILLCSSGDLAVPETLAHLGIRVCRVEFGELFDGLRLDAGRTPEIYLRLALPAAFARDYDRILYMDSDIFVQGGDFGALLRVDLGTHPLGAVRDNRQWRTPSRRPEQFQRLGLKASPYFNGGVQLLDVARYNEKKVLERCVAFGRAHATKLMRHDQNLLNAVLQGDWAELSPVWNWQYTWSSRLFEAMAEAHVLHFIGTRKPWNHSQGEYPLRFRRAFQAFIERHFPGRKPLPPEGPPPFGNGAYLRKMLFKHLLSERAMSRYVSRFPTDLTVHLRPEGAAAGISVPQPAPAQ
jgi:hypothetical protein